MDDRIPVLYLAPFLDIGGSDKGTLDWFRFLDRDRFAPSLITTQPGLNRRMADVIPYADEVWDLPDLMAGDDFARFIITFIVTRRIRLVHVMNSRLGFELLAEIAGLPERPRVVVQLHVEEPERDGYVRYVSTRYGNLVDAFSVSSRTLSDQLGRYDVPTAKRRIIRTGVDARHEFSPGRVTPVAGLDPGRLNILFPARLLAQKDPLLMVEVAAQLKTTGLDFQVQVLGDGDLKPAVAEYVRTARLERQVSLHGERVDIAPWYAGCDVVLLTSRFEGVPYVAYEAMAMATPIVAPDLPGVRELVTPGTGVLVSPRGQAGPYAAALAALGGDPARRQELGRAGREQVLSECSLERMAAEHGALYEELLAPLAPGATADRGRSNGVAPPPVSAALRGRRPGSTPLVSVIVPCFNDGHFLRECLRSIAGQSYERIETIVVDNASTDPETRDLFAELEREGQVRVLRIDVNRGPSPARNAAIECAGGRYVLPVDADNILPPDAVAALVEQLGSAGENIGFIYPNYQFFGNRQDYFEVPSYNLQALMSANYCDTCSLIDREIFDRGFRYSEEIVLGYEDWDLVLTLAEHGIYGEPAQARTLLFRKHGFTRADRVETGGEPFAEVVKRRHPGLYGARARLKAEWSPAVTIIALDPLDPGHGDALGNLLTSAGAQTCSDFELVIRTAQEIWPSALGRRLRRIPEELTASRAQALAAGLAMARGRYVLATYGSAAAALADRSFVEKALRVLQGNPLVAGLAFASAEGRLGPFRLLGAENARDARLSALCWASIGSRALPASLELDGDRPLETIARWLSAHDTLQWRHLPRRDRRAVGADGGGPPAAVGAPRHARARDARQRELDPPLLPQLPDGIAPRVARSGTWMPPQARVLCRHLHHESGRYVFTNDRNPPRGCSFEYALGCPRGLPFAGTVSLISDSHRPEGGFAVGRPVELDAPELLGFIEQAPLPQFDPLHVGRHRVTGQRVLHTAQPDPLSGLVDDATFIGFIEPHPIHPRLAPQAEVSYGLVGLLSTIDVAARRHRYRAGGVPGGELRGELGALFSEPTGDCDPLWIDADDRVLPPPAYMNGRPSLLAAGRWAGAPLAWRGFGPVGPRVRASMRRSYESARILTSSPTPHWSAAAEPTGYLLRSPTSRTVPLYLAIHPVTGDQLLSTNEQEPRLLGYKAPARLGYLIASAPVTGRLGVGQRGIPWASRFGRPIGVR